MGEYCTCGAALPPDARFCHRCGKPQREEDVPREEIAEATAPAPPPLPAAPAEISFANRNAVRAAMLAAALMYFLLFLLPLPPVALVLALPLLLGGAGFISVLFYRRSGNPILTTRRGAKIGWITGVFCFVIQMVLTTVNVVASSSEGGWMADSEKSLEQLGMPPDAARQMAETMRSPATMAFSLLLGLALWFGFITLLSTIGGWVGGNVARKQE